MQDIEFDFFEYEIDFDSFSDESFDLKKSIEEAIIIYESLVEEGIVLQGDFESEKWIWLMEERAARAHFNFERLQNMIKFQSHISEDFVLIVKCWILNLSRQFSIKHIRGIYANILVFLQITNYFKDSPDVVEERIRDLAEVSKTKRSKVTSWLFFLDFCEIEQLQKYKNLFISLKNSLSAETRVRELPRAIDVFKLANCIEKYFKEDLSKEELLFFLPVKLWWKITNIIPMRPIEFCNIKRDCINRDGNRFFLRLPRRKRNPNFEKKTLGVTDTLEIDKEMYELINNYINLTVGYGKTKTLISYPSIVFAAKKFKLTGRENKIYHEIFNWQALSTLVGRFYEDIVFKKYKLTVEKKVNLNDTRHITFTSLLLQGISPIEIARLGGHTTLKAQYHYQQNIGFYVDTEIYKLSKDGIKGLDFEDIVIREKINNMPVSPPVPLNECVEMDLGHCTDLSMPCEHSRHCVFCSKWWVEPMPINLRIFTTPK
ncbi:MULTISPECIES: site-specific integrase [unclassified Bacillus cereus group]|nr:MULTISPECIES: site-specific integrase [unclassified Bacillus cereus group]MDA2663956.1 site-specific integrase [Bacillus cereus group sp. Bc032]MDA2674609.1 site-specific integrase [Bacillus cereus group sp. Bc031]MDA2679961.1 site-specific integrase [Bacillus cereus group sp. Bc029]MDA2685612.1 site-specific integrase [Bacillus cereus group sp. Bc030]MDA2741008.1 site-specific integrase [Bacillus cereus group sp. Bc011]